MHLIATKGIEKTNIREIAAASDMTIGNLYHYIGTREDVIYLAFQYGLDQVRKVIKEINDLCEMMDPREALKAAIDLYIRYHHSNHEDTVFLYKEMGGLSPSLRLPVIETNSHLHELFIRIIQKGCKTGAFRAANIAVARLGGDEFVVMLEDLSDSAEVAAAQAKAVGDKILEAVGQTFLLDGHECLSTSSMGLTVFRDHKEASDLVLQQADIAMYQAKSAGRNTLRFFAPALQAAVNARASLEGDLRRAIHNGQFELWYQPQMDQGRMTGAEALIRWNHPERGLLLPGEFISLAEETGLILAMGDWVLEAASEQNARWAKTEDAAHLKIAVNISPRQFRQSNFVEHVLAIVERTGANPENLKLELTEGMLVDNIEDVVAKMTELKEHGLRFSLDDFGTGYSSLSYLTGCRWSN